MRIPMGLQEDVQHCAGFIDGPPQPVFLATDLDADLIQEPPGTPSRLPVAELFSEERRELDVPLTQGFVADDDPALVEEFLDITLAQGKPVVQPQGVLDDAQREAARRRVRRPFWPRNDVGRACGQSRTISLSRLTCQNPSRPCGLP